LYLCGSGGYVSRFWTTSTACIARRTTGPKKRATSAAWPIWTPPISASNCCSKSCSTFGMVCGPPPPRRRRPRLRSRTQAPIRSLPSIRFAASPNSGRRFIVRRAPYVVALSLIAACGSKADLVIQGGPVWTGLSTGRGKPGAVAIAGGKILAVGDSAELARYIGSKTQVLDARGGLIMPGFADGHTHFVDGGFQLASIDLRNAASPQEFVRRIKEYAAHLKPGEWILGGDWDHTLWRGALLPRHDWIDSVTPNNPLFLSRLDGHMALANAAAMRAAKVTNATRAPVGGEMPRDARGEPTGIFKDNAEGLIDAAIPAPSAEQEDSALSRALVHAASLGVTATGNMSASWANLAAYKRMEHAGRMTLRVSLYLPLEDWHTVADSVRQHDAGDDWVRIGGVKGYMD